MPQTDAACSRVRSLKRSVSTSQLMFSAVDLSTTRRHVEGLRALHVNVEPRSLRLDLAEGDHLLLR